MSEEKDDTRVICIDCRHLQRGLCLQPKRAGLAVDRMGKCEIGPALAALPQRCFAFKPHGRTDV